MKKLTIVVTDNSKLEIGRFSFRFVLPNGAVCSDTGFSTSIDAAQAAMGMIRNKEEFDITVDMDYR